MDDPARPTFFEMVAAERLTPSLKAAFAYSLWVYAQRRPWLRRALDYEDEVCGLATFILEHSSLTNSGGSLSESLYGLKRTKKLNSNSNLNQWDLPPQQKRMSLLFLVLMPYLRAKLHAVYHQSNQPAIQLTSRQNTTGEPSVEGVSGRGQWHLLIEKCKKIFIALYPWLHLSVEGSELVYQILYLVGKTPYFSPWLHFQDLKVTRVSGDDLVYRGRQRQLSRWERVNRIQNRTRLVWLKGLHEYFVRAGFFMADYGRHALVLTVFAFKALEWWFTTGEEKLNASQALPVPDPPPAPLPHTNGISLPDDPTLCPLCMKPRTNPAQLVASGYVFCYRCLYKHVEKESKCPITLLPASFDHIRRLFKGS